MAQLNQIGTHKTAISEDGVTKVIYHRTPVVQFDANIIILNSGGWRTNSTKTRMNQASNQFDLGFRIVCINKMWFVEYRGETLSFEDKMILNR